MTHVAPLNVREARFLARAVSIRQQNHQFPMQFFICMTNTNHIPDAAQSRQLVRASHIRPFMVTRKQLCSIFNSPRLVQRMLAHGWIDVVVPGKSGRETLFDYTSAEHAYSRLKAGETPALLPCEAKGAVKS